LRDHFLNAGSRWFAKIFKAQPPAAKLGARGKALRSAPSKLVKPRVSAATIFSTDFLCAPAMHALSDNDKSRDGLNW